MIGVPAMIVSAKTVQATLPLLLVAALAGAAVRGRLASARPALGGVTLSLLAFLLYASLSAFWAREPQASFSIVLMAGAVCIGSLVLVAMLQAEDLDDSLHMGEGLWIGLAAGLAYAVAEIASDQGIKIWVYNMLQLGPDVLEPARYFTWENGRIVAIHSDDLTRNAVPIPLLLWPALMATGALPAHIWRPVVAALLVVLSAAAVLCATSESAKIALIIAMLSFAAACFCARAVRYALSLAWSVACLAVVPLVMLARSQELQNADWLQLSAQIRITIWSEIARRVWDAPLFGVGADMTYHTEPPMREAPATAPDWLNYPITHPHNIYLQVWYELGLVGALLLTLLGIMVLSAAARLDARYRPYAFAMFAALATQIGFSYNLWQIWFMCLFGFAAAMLTVGQRVLPPNGSPVAR